MHADVWGTAGQWFSGLASGGALALGFYIMLRDRRKEERAQARLITCWREPEMPVADADGDATYPGLIHITNHSTRPIYDITAKPLLVSWSEYRRRVANVPAIGKPKFSEEEWKSPSGKLYSFAFSTIKIANKGRLLEPEKSLAAEFSAPTTARYYDVIVEFTDAEGLTWSRNVDTSNLRRTGGRRALHYSDGLEPKRRTPVDALREARDRKTR